MGNLIESPALYMEAEKIALKLNILLLSCKIAKREDVALRFGLPLFSLCAGLHNVSYSQAKFGNPW